MPTIEPRTLDQLLADAEAVIDRITPAEAVAAMAEGCVLIDTRSADARVRHGIVPGTLHIPRTVLEWRLEPAGPWRSPYAPEPGARVIVLCDAGYSSVFAAAQLAALGYVAADVIGGFAAWREAGLPVAPTADAPLLPEEQPGMRRPQ